MISQFEAIQRWGEQIGSLQNPIKKTNRQAAQQNILANTAMLGKVATTWLWLILWGGEHIAVTYIATIWLAHCTLTQLGKPSAADI